MEQSEKRKLLAAILATQCITGNVVDYLLRCCDNNVMPGRTTDPLSQFVYQSVMGTETEDDALNAIDYGIEQLKKTRHAFT